MTHSHSPYPVHPSSRSRRLASGTVGLSVLLVLATVALAGNVSGARSGGTAPASTLLGSLASPDAVAASPTGLYALSAKSCSTVYSISATGSVTTYATLPKLAKCPQQSIAVSPGLGNFAPGWVYVTQGASIYAIPPDNSGAKVSTPWVSIPALSASPTGLSFDYYGDFGYGLLVTGGANGQVFAVDSAAKVFPFAAIGAAVQGPSVAPLGFRSSGGDLLVGDPTSGSVYAVGSSGQTSSVASWKGAVSVAFVPQRACALAGTEFAYFVADTSSNAIRAFPSADFAAYTGDALVVSGTKHAGIGLLPSAGGTPQTFYSTRDTLGGSAYVTCPIGVASTVPVASTVYPNLIGFDAAGGQLIGSDANSTNLLVLDGTTGQIVGTQPGGRSPFALTLNPKKQVVFITNTGSNNVSLLNASTAQPEGSLTGLVAPTGIAYDAHNQKLYVANSGDGTVEVFSQVSNQFTSGSISVGGEPLSVAFDPLDLNVYVANGAGYVTVISPTFNHTQVIPLAAGAYGIAVNTTSGIVYATEPSANDVAVIQNGTVVANIAVGLGPTGVAFDSLNGLVFVANGGAGSLSVIQGSTVIDTVVIGGSPGPLVFDPISGLVYVTADVTTFGLDPRIILGVSS